LSEFVLYAGLSGPRIATTIGPQVRGAIDISVVRHIKPVPVPTSSHIQDPALFGERAPSHGSRANHLGFTRFTALTWLKQAALVLSVFPRPLLMGQPYTPRHGQRVLRHILGAQASSALTRPADQGRATPGRTIATNDEAAHRDRLPPRVVALVPAAPNAVLPETLGKLAAQARRPDRVIVIVNNCGDQTAAMAAQARQLGAEALIMEGANPQMKSGALNYALERVLPSLADDDAILVQDSDSFLDPEFISVTARKLADGYAAAGGNFRGREGGGMVGWFQSNEYARYARDTARKQGNVLCITGVGTLFRVSALRAVAAAIKSGRLPGAAGGHIYSYATITEDNWMTLALKHLGYRVVSPKDATMSTEVMPTWGKLARQRLRWKRGAFEDLLNFGLTRHTVKGWGFQVVAILGILATLAYFATLLASPWLGFHLHTLFLSITMLYAVERAVTVRSRGWKVMLLSATVLPEWGYDLFLQAVQLRALTGIMLRTRKSWGTVSVAAASAEPVMPTTAE
jgi:cellulose synthase/poly-beta-1,6-N-acetylglucosamine synthase-like glycosyltransferase